MITGTMAPVLAIHGADIIIHSTTKFLSGHVVNLISVYEP